MNISTATKAELLEYEGWLMEELEKELTPEEVGYLGVTWKEYKELRKYMISRLVAVNNRLLEIG